jgi:hypothetical protein
MLSKNCAHDGQSTPGCKVGDEQFNNEEINRLYDDDDNPLRTPSSD